METDLLPPYSNKLLRLRAIDCMYAQYSDLENVTDLPQVPHQEFTKEVVNEAYEMALFMNQHPGIKSVSYQELKKLIAMPETVETAEEIVKPVPLIRTYRYFPFYAPLRKVLFPEVFWDIQKLNDTVYYGDYCDFINFKNFSAIAFYLHEHPGIYQITYSEVCVLAGIEDDTLSIKQKFIEKLV